MMFFFAYTDFSLGLGVVISSLNIAKHGVGFGRAEVSIQPFSNSGRDANDGKMAANRTGTGRTEPDKTETGETGETRETGKNETRKTGIAIFRALKNQQRKGVGKCPPPQNRFSGP